MQRWIFTLLLGVASLSFGASPKSADILPIEKARRVWPVTQELTAPESLRPCCAFGYDLQVRAVGVPIPVYQIGNILTLTTLGHHRYNDSALGAVKNIVGLSEEKSGLIYTRRGGFIDIAHVRDTADNTFYLFTQIYSRLGQDWRLFYSEELGVRRIQLHAFNPPASMVNAIRLRPGLRGISPSSLRNGMRLLSGMDSSRFRDFLRRYLLFRPKISIPIYWAQGWR